MGELPCDFEVVFRHFVMKMSEHKLLQNGLHVRARANQSFSVSFSEFSVRGGPSKILHPLQRGCQTRLTIRNKSKTNLMVRRAGLSRLLSWEDVHQGGNLGPLQCLGFTLFCKSSFNIPTDQTITASSKTGLAAALCRRGFTSQSNRTL